MKKIDLLVALDKLEKAYNRLEQALLIVQSELDKEAIT